MALYGSGPLAKYVLALGDLRWAWVVGQYSLFVELLAPQAACMLEGSFRVFRVLVYTGAFLKNRLIRRDEWIVLLAEAISACVRACTSESLFGKGRISSGYHNKTSQWLQQRTFLLTVVESGSLRWGCQHCPLPGKGAPSALAFW